MHAQLRICAALSLAALVLAQAGCASHGGTGRTAPEEGRPPFLAASVTRQPAADFSGSPTGASVRAKENQVYAGFRRLEAAGGTLDLDFDYQYTRYIYDGIDGRNRDLHRFQFPVNYRAEIEDWKIDGSVAPGISTSSNVLKDFFDRIGSDDLFATVRLEGRRESSSHDWVIGLAYDRVFGRPLVYPIAGIEWSPSEAMDVRLAFPDSGFRYRWGDRQSLSGRLFPAGHQWHVMTDDFDAEFDYRVEGIRAQLGWSIRLWKEVTLDVSGGYEFARKHYLTDDLGVRIESDVDDQWLLLFGLRAGQAPLPYTHGSQL
jgi:hypothetical protein